MNCNHPIDPGVRQWLPPFVSRRFLCATFLAWGVASHAVAAEPYIPRSHDEVIERLPRQLLSNRSELAVVRRALLANPNNEEIAVKVANHYIQMGNAAGDPRFYGYARAAIRPWWTLPSPQPATLKLRAKLKEKDHRYKDALADLQALLDKAPRDVQALIETSNIYRVLGRYKEAKQIGDLLSTFSTQVPITLCRAPLQAVTGHAKQAFQELDAAMPLAESRWPGVVPWMLTVQAQISQSLGDSVGADKLYRSGLSRAPENKYLIRAYADFLCDRGRPGEALELTRDHIRDNGTLLRAAIAAQLHGNAKLARDWKRKLRRRFDEIEMRGGQPHGRFEARYELELNANPKRALVIALKNWSQQKELRDIRIVLEASVASKNAAAAQPALAFMAQHGTEDVILDKLRRQLEHL